MRQQDVTERPTCAVRLAAVIDSSTAGARPSAGAEMSFASYVADMVKKNGWGASGGTNAGLRGSRAPLPDRG